MFFSSSNDSISYRFAYMICLIPVTEMCLIQFQQGSIEQYNVAPSNEIPLIIRNSLVISFSICVDDGIGIVLNSVVLI